MILSLIQKKKKKYESNETFAAQFIASIYDESMKKIDDIFNR